MSTIVWNARGLGYKRAFLMLQQMVEDLRPLLLFICESKISCNIARNWFSKLRFNHVFGVDAKGTKGGLLLFWCDNVNVLLRSYSSSHIDVSVGWESFSWRFTGCYAPSIPEERVAFWNLLGKLYNLRSDDYECWLLGGDFNDIMYSSEKRGGNNWRKKLEQNGLYNCCSRIGVKFVDTLGPKYTWTNNRKGRYNIREKLDRFMANERWSLLFPKACARNCGFYGSDHRVIKLLLNVCKWIPKSPPKNQFMFENKWLLKDGFMPKAIESWKQTSSLETLWQDFNNVETGLRNGRTKRLAM